MTAREIRERLAFAAEIHDKLVDERISGTKEEISGLEKAIKVLTDMVMEMGRENERSGEETGASAGETVCTERQGQ